MAETGRRAPLASPSRSEAEASSDVQSTETQMRRALGLNPGGPTHTPQQRPEQARARHRFVQDGGVPVVMLNHKPEPEVAALRERVMALEATLETERAALVRRQAQPDRPAGCRAGAADPPRAYRAGPCRGDRKRAPAAPCGPAGPGGCRGRRRGEHDSHHGPRARPASPAPADDPGRHGPGRGPGFRVSPGSDPDAEAGGAAGREGQARPAPHQPAARAQAAPLVDPELQGQDEGLRPRP